MKKFTKEQLRLYKSLIKLGDSKKVAYETVIRTNPPSKDTTDFYNFAYTK